jgi:cytoskeletal protein RodZ
MDDMIKQPNVNTPINNNSNKDLFDRISEDDKLEQSKRIFTAPPKKKKSKVKPLLSVLLILTVLGGLSYGAYWWQNDQSQKSKQDKEKIATLQAENAELVKKTEASSDEDSDTTPINGTEVKNLVDAIKSKNYAAIEGYLANEVQVVLAASEAGGMKTPKQAVESLDFLKPAKDPWDFELSKDVLNKYKNGDYGQYFPYGSIAGKSSDNYVISFTFDSNGAVNGIFLTNNTDVLN